MGRIKIIFFVRDMGRCAGAERVLAIIANGLSKRGYSVIILNREGMGPAFFPLDGSVKVYWLDDSKGPWNSIKLMSRSKTMRMRIFLKHEKPDFLIDVDIVNSLVSFFMKDLVAGMRWYAWECMTCFYHADSHSNYNFRRKLAQILIGKSADRLLVLTDADKDAYRNNKRLKCEVSFIYNPLPYKEKFLKRVEKKIILAVGRLVNEKGFDLLIKSWKALEQGHLDWIVLIAGEGEERKKLEEHAGNAGLRNIKFIGNKKNIEEFYAEAAFFVLPSRSEPFGMVLIEAMHFSLPVISYDCESGPGEIITDGQDGFLIPPGDTKLFADKMELLINDKRMRRSMGENAQRSVRRFEQDLILDQWEELFKG